VSAVPSLSESGRPLDAVGRQRPVFVGIVSQLAGLLQGFGPFGADGQLACSFEGGLSSFPSLISHARLLWWHMSCTRPLPRVAGPHALLQVKLRRRNLRKQKNQNPVTKLDCAQFFPICNIFLLKLCANVRDVETRHKSIIMNAIDHGRGCSAEFSDLYLRLLNAALDEASPPLSPQAREYNLAAHVARGISMTGIVGDSFSNQALGHEETGFL
jgi:hypothetical protein